MKAPIRRVHIPRIGEEPSHLPPADGDESRAFRHAAAERRLLLALAEATPIRASFQTAQSGQISQRQHRRARGGDCGTKQTKPRLIIKARPLRSFSGGQAPPCTAETSTASSSAVRAPAAHHRSLIAAKGENVRLDTVFEHAAQALVANILISTYRLNIHAAYPRDGFGWKLRIFSGLF